MLVEAATTGRRRQARLTFARGGGTTVLTGQHVPYPFHVTRPFRLHPERPDLATLYLQSASGGLYRGDHLGLEIEARAGASAHVTTQSATVVHDTGSAPARQDMTLRLGPGALLAVTPDPLILFPGAALETVTRIVADPSARAIATEGFACHDPSGMGRPFAAVDIGLRIEVPTGATLVRERARLTGAALAGPASPLGRYRAWGTVVVLVAPDAVPDGAAMQAAADAVGCLSGAGPLPSGAGLALRLLAPDGGTLSAGLEAAVAVAFEALVGIAPGRRRK